MKFIQNELENENISKDLNIEVGFKFIEITEEVKTKFRI